MPLVDYEEADNFEELEQIFQRNSEYYGRYSVYESADLNVSVERESFEFFVLLYSIENGPEDHYNYAAYPDEIEVFWEPGLSATENHQAFVEAVVREAVGYIGHRINARISAVPEVRVV